MQQYTIEVIQTAGDIEPTLLSKTILSVFSEEDMRHPLYRYTILTYLQAFVERDIGITRQLPPIEDSPASILSDRNRIDIELDDKDELFFEGKRMELEKLRPTLIRYLKGSETNEQYPETTKYKDSAFGEVVSSKAVVSIKNDRLTSYKMYVEVQNEVVAAYAIILDEKAKKYFGSNFDSLSEEQHKKIEEIVPMKISEAVPE